MFRSRKLKKHQQTQCLGAENQKNIRKTKKNIKTNLKKQSQLPKKQKTLGKPKKKLGNHGPPKFREQSLRIVFFVFFGFQWFFWFFEGLALFFLVFLVSLCLFLFSGPKYWFILVFFGFLAQNIGFSQSFLVFWPKILVFIFIFFCFLA